jgi:hypothetical protein
MRACAFFFSSQHRTGAQYLADICTSRARNRCVCSRYVFQTSSCEAVSHNGRHSTAARIASPCSRLSNCVVCARVRSIDYRGCSFYTNLNHLRTRRVKFPSACQLVPYVHEESKVVSTSACSNPQVLYPNMYSREEVSKVWIGPFRVSLGN